MRYLRAGLPIAEVWRDMDFRRNGPVGDIDQGRVSLVNGRSENSVADAAITRDRPERPPALAC